MLRQVSSISFRLMTCLFMRASYDLDLDTRLSEETTVLVETYEVCLDPVSIVLSR